MVEPIKLFEKNPELKCECCGKDLLADMKGLIIIVKDMDRNILRLHPSCRGKCDKILSNQLNKNEIDGWKGLDELSNPILFLKWVCSIMNVLKENNREISDDAFIQIKDLILTLAPYVIREPLEKEFNEAGFDAMSPV